MRNTNVALWVTVVLLASPWLSKLALADSGWNIQTVDSIGNVGKNTSLAVDASGNPHISYQDSTNDDLKYSHWNGTNWSCRLRAAQASAVIAG